MLFFHFHFILKILQLDITKILYTNFDYGYIDIHLNIEKNNEL